MQLAIQKEVETSNAALGSDAGFVPSDTQQQYSGLRGHAGWGGLRGSALNDPRIEHLKWISSTVGIGLGLGMGRPQPTPMAWARGDSPAFKMLDSTIVSFRLSIPREMRAWGGESFQKTSYHPGFRGGQGLSVDPYTYGMQLLPFM